MNLQTIAERLENTHELVSKRENCPNKVHWLSLSLNSKYQEVRKNRSKFLVLKGQNLDAANKLFAFLPYILDEKRSPIEGHYSTHAWIQRAITCMFYESIVSLSLHSKEWTIADIILKDNYDYELSAIGAKKWFDRNYPRTFNEIGVTNEGIRDGRDEWPLLRCHLFSYGSYDEVRLWENC